MATYRPVYINIWKDPTFEGYKPPMKLIFIYLITNESTTESGIYPITIKTISNETGIPIKMVEKLLSNGLKNVAYDFKNNFIFIKNFLKYSSGGGRPDLLQKSIEKNYKNFNTPLWNEFMLIYPEYSNTLQTVGKPLTNCCSDVASISNAISKDISKDINTLSTLGIDVSNETSTPVPDIDNPDPPKEPEKLKSDKPKKDNPNKRIIFDRTPDIKDAKFIGITQGDIDAWEKAYPAADLDAEVAKAIVWIYGAEAKGYKSKWYSFLNGWFSRCQDRGGTKNGR